MMPMSAPGNKPFNLPAISVTQQPEPARSGRSTPKGTLRGVRARAHAGFTLLEMLIVLVIAGILVSLASVQLTRNPRTDLNEEAQRLALLFESAGDEAQVRSRPIAWLPLDDLLRPRGWEGGVTGVSIQFAGSDQSATRVVFGTEAIDTPMEVTLVSAAGRATIVGTGNGRYQVR
jgi:general secretion pathway protein H